MKKVFYLAAAAMAVLSSCDKENMLVENGAGSETINAPVFTATIENHGTKTSLGNAGKVNWETGDEVLMMFANENNDDQGIAAYVYEATPGADASSATLAHKSDVLVLDPAANILMMAVYPASMVSLTEGVVFPATQTYNGDGKIPFAPMVYMGDLAVTNIEFKNAASLLKITVPYAQMHSVSSITVSSNLVMNGDVIYDTSGYFYIDTEDCGPVSDENSKLTLSCGNVEIPADGSKTFYISILPLSPECDYHVQAQCYDYLQIDVTDGTTTKSMRTKKAGGIQIERNKIYPINFEENYSPAPAYEYVDLGLRVKWATMNVGATKPEEYGDYFAWGATEPLYEAGHAQDNPQRHWKDGKTAGYTYVNTPYQTANTTSPSSTRWTKYLGSTTSKYKDPSATDANALKTVLDLEDDAAHVNWGGSWRMPTSAELDELRNENNCTWTWTTLNGVNGYKVQSKKAGYTDNWIFLPAAGFRDESTIGRVDNEGNYWSSSLFTGDSYMAHQFYFFGSSSVNMCVNPRLLGLSVRPVCE